MTHTATAEERRALAEERLEEYGCCGGDCHLGDDEGLDADPVEQALESAVIDAINGLARIARNGGPQAITAAEALLRYSEPSPF